MLLTENETSPRLREFITEAEEVGLTFISEDRLQKGRRIGSGTFSLVSEAEYGEAVNGKTSLVAIKELKTNRGNFSMRKTILISEASLMARLDHPYILRYLGCGLFQNRAPYMVQEIMQGGSIDGYMEQLRRRRVAYDAKKSYSLRSALKWCKQVTSAVEYLHSKGIEVIHRDIKLSNLLLTDKDIEKADVKLADFGLAVETEKKEYSQNKLRCFNSQKVGKGKKKSSGWWNCWWTFNPFNKVSALEPVDVPELQTYYPNDCYDLSQGIGSYMYMSPEVFLGVPYNEKADIYSLGILIAELLTGMPLSCCVLPEKSYDEAKNFAFCISRGLRLKCPKSYPKPLTTLLEACWQRDPAKRPTASELLKDLLLYEASCTNVEECCLLPSMSLSFRQKISLTLGRASNVAD